MKVEMPATDPKPDPEPEPGFFRSKNSSVILLKIESPLTDPEPQLNLGSGSRIRIFWIQKTFLNTAGTRLDSLNLVLIHV